MGLEQLRSEVINRRGGLSQKRAAAEWGVPVATIAAVEQRLRRKFRPATIGVFDEPFGWKPGTAYNMLEGTEPPTASDVQTLTLRVDELAATVARLVAAPVPSGVQARLLSVLGELDDDEVAQLTATAEWLAARRRRASG
jgi:hypothetical protein